MRVRAWVDRWGDGIVALALTIAIENELWVRPPAGLSVTGGRGVAAVIIALVTVPLAWRRRAPLAVLLVVTGAVLAASLLIHHGDGMPLEAFLALILAFYSVGAHCDDRRGLLGGGADLAVLLAYDLLHGGLGQAYGSRPGLCSSSRLRGSWAATSDGDGVTSSRCATGPRSSRTSARRGRARR